MSFKRLKAILAIFMFLGLSPSLSYAGLVAFQSYNGMVGVSTDGVGSTSNTGIVSASVASGSTVLSAFLYTATYTTTGTPMVTLNGNNVSFGPRVPNDTACCNLASHRADVTSIVKPIIDAGPGGIYDFDYTESMLGSNTDGSALIVVYENPALPESTVGLLDGFASVTGDTTSINFADPLDPDDPNFFAEMALGIGFSCCNQRSRVEVNGMLLTENAGNFDDGNTQSNGALFTMGSFDDPIAPPNPSYAEDTERYDLTPFVSQGDTTITVDTINASQDDNIFLAVFSVFGEAGINAPPPSDPNPDPTAMPEPEALAILGLGLLFLGLSRRRRQA